jgi:hypothetical protein
LQRIATRRPHHAPFHLYVDPLDRILIRPRASSIIKMIAGTLKTQTFFQRARAQSSC